MSKPAVVIFLILFCALPAVADPSSITFSYAAGSLYGEDIVESVLSGHRSEVRYEMRVYRKVNGLLSIFGDDLVHSEDLTYVARWDPLDHLFVVLIDGSRERSFSDKEDFLAFLMALTDQTLAISESFSGNEYLLCRTRIQPIKLVPPLTLMTLIKSDLQTISEWQRIAFQWPAE